MNGEKKKHATIEVYDRSNDDVPMHGHQEQEKKRQVFFFFSRSPRVFVEWLERKKGIEQRETSLLT